MSVERNWFATVGGRIVSVHLEDAVLGPLAVFEYDDDLPLCAIYVASMVYADLPEGLRLYGDGGSTWLVSPAVFRSIVEWLVAHTPEVRISPLTDQGRA